MDYIFFSKLVRELSIPHLIEVLKQIGADGVDLCVREGYPVNPDNAREELPRAARRIREAGLVIPMITAPTSLIDPAAPIAEMLFAACHDAQILHIKLGYWGYRPGNYWKQVDTARRQVEGFEKIGMRFGVKACLHTHSGNNLGLNAAAIMHLARGFNPSHIGVYLDPGHLALNGEPLPIAFDMVGEYLALVAIKDALWEKEKSVPPRRARFVPLGEGMVDWREMMRVLLARGYAGPLSFHSEFEAPGQRYLLEQTQRDIQYLRNVEKQVRDSAGAARV